MPLDYVIRKERRLIVVTASGSVTSADVKACRDRCLRDPDFNPEFDGFVDFRRVTILNMSGEEAGELAGTEVFSSKSRVAFVVQTLANLTMTQLYATANRFSEAHSQMRVFEGLPSAVEWLGIESDFELRP